MFEIDELRFGVETLKRRVLVVAVDGAMSDTSIFEILNEVRGEEALSDAAFAVNDEVDLFVHGWWADQRLRGSATRGPRVRVRSVGASFGGG